MQAQFVAPPQRGVWLRRSRRNYGFALGWGTIAVGSIAMGGVMLGLPNVTLANRIGAASVWVFPGLVVLKVAIGCWRAGVLITDTEVVVRGPWMTRRFTIAAVDRFEAKPQEEMKGGNPTAGVVLVLRDGRRFDVWALAKEGLVWNTEKIVSGWAPTADALNGLVRGADAAA
jgi:hypothetical protein